MASQTIKVEVSLPKEEFQAVEKLRRQMKKSRNAVIAEAIHHWLRTKRDVDQEAEDIRRYIEGYKKYPETEEEIMEAATISHIALADEEWKE